MTVFPQTPKLKYVGQKDGREMRRLTEDHVTVLNYCLGWSLVVVVKAGYETDGATVSLSSLSSKEEKKIKKIIHKHKIDGQENSIIDWLIGTPWDLPRLLAAIVHDGLYSIKWRCRYMCDRVYKKILKAASYSAVRREIEYDVIRLLGWNSWNKVSTEEQRISRKLIKVKFVRTSKVGKLLEQISKTEQKRKV